MKAFISLTLLIICQLSWAQTDVQIKSQVRHAIDELRDFIAIPNDALETSDINRNLSWLTTQFSKRGFNTSVLPTEGQSLFFATLPMEDNKPTLLLYMHFDGQSVDPAKWDQPDPYKVELKAPMGDGWETKSFDSLNDDIDYSWRLFGRSTSDDKGPIVMFLNAMDLLRKNEATIPFNIKVILDGEEEKSSKPLAKAVQSYKELLVADFLVIADGPVHPSEKPTIAYGCRGITTLSLTTYGPIKPQHSGHYGNYAPNPGMRLAKLLSGMKDDQGRVTISGYYDGISLPEDVQKVLESVPDDTELIHDRLAIKSAEKVGSFYQESLQYPSLNVRGLGSGWVGATARTIVPASATAELDLRLVPETDGNRLKKLVIDHIKGEGYFVTNTTPTKVERLSHDKIITILEGSVTDAFRTPLDNPYGIYLEQVLKNTFEDEVVQIRIMGGTVPIAPFINALEIPAFIVPMVNPDNNQHSPNENLRIGQLAYGIQLFSSLLSTPYLTP
ncbi:MAG: M20/M25/M40 family metallo-hydrolase [Eudoraea sp.]|nr:M20/M25/M40 family metallo-hydrolase [Eudoraea sp.]